MHLISLIVYNDVIFIPDIFDTNAMIPYKNVLNIKTSIYDIIKKRMTFSLTGGTDYMKYYLVAVLDRESNKEVDSLQKNLHRRGKKILKAPYIGIPIDTVEDPDRDRLSELLQGLLKPFRYFHVEVRGTYITLPEEKLSGLAVTNFGYIRKIRRHLNSYMELSGFKVSELNDDDESDLILSLSVEKLPREIDTTQNLFKNEENKKNLRVEKIELWKTMNAKKDSVVLSIPLKNPSII